jgi:prepilin-type N-terminal cleavage/methylation domain-containing protein
MGFSLPELIIAASILSIIMVVSVSIYMMSQRAWREGAVEVALFNTANAIIQMMTEDLLLAQEVDIPDSVSEGTPGGRVSFRLPADVAAGSPNKWYYLQDADGDGTLEVCYFDGTSVIAIVRDPDITVTRLEFRPIDDLNDPNYIGISLGLEQNLVGTRSGGELFTVNIQTLVNRRN